MQPYLKAERVRSISGLLQQGFMHGGQSGLVTLRVDLDVLQPDVLPEAQPDHIQVITTVPEGARQLHENCKQRTSDSLFRFFQTSFGKK